MSHPVLSIIADHTGAVVAGAASSLGALAFAAGQVPVPPGISPELVWAAVTFGPPLAWFGVVVLKAAASYAITRRKRATARADMLRAAGRPVDDDEVERHLDSADRWSSVAAALGRADDEIDKRRAS